MPASTTKVITALVAVQHIPPGRWCTVISPRAESMPARKINLKAGQHWKLDDLLHAAAAVSANDAAVALAQAAVGSDEGFVRLAAATARRIGMARRPCAQRPRRASTTSSASQRRQRDQRPRPRRSRHVRCSPSRSWPSIVATPDYRFVGGDGQPHHLTNHNRLLTTYAGAIGVKTGATEAGGSLPHRAPPTATGAR